MMDAACSICARVSEARGGSPALVRDFPTSVLVVGDHRYFPGYCLLLLKAHVRELHELELSAQRALFEELMEASRAVARAYKPWKLNHASLGNQDPHVHWHIIPRYEDDPDRRSHPWLRADRFDGHRTDDALKGETAARLRAAMERTGP